jgi:hypothetical protein
MKVVDFFLPRLLLLALRFKQLQLKEPTCRTARQHRSLIAPKKDMWLKMGARVQDFARMIPI